MWKTSFKLDKLKINRWGPEKCWNPRMEGECEQWMLTSLSSGAVQISLIIDSSRRGTLHDIVTRIDINLWCYFYDRSRIYCIYIQCCIVCVIFCNVVQPCNLVGWPGPRVVLEVSNSAQVPVNKKDNCNKIQEVHFSSVPRQ